MESDVWAHSFRADSHAWNIVVEGGPYSEGTAQIMEHLFGNHYTVRSLGSTALSLTWTALGHFDVFVQAQTSIWDYAAGAALILEAGGAFCSPLLGEKSPFIIGGAPNALAEIYPVVERLLASVGFPESA